MVELSCFLLGAACVMESLVLLNVLRRIRQLESVAREASQKLGVIEYG